MKNFLSIKEFSRFSGIERTTLRYWDDIGLFSPAKRDPENNYRYYSPEQIISVNFIKVLSSLQVPLKVIDAAKYGRKPEHIVELIEKQELLLDKEMSRLRECYSIIHARRDLIKAGMQAELHHISVVNLPELAMIMGEKTGLKESEPFYEAFIRFCRQAKELRINLSYPIGGFHESMERFLKAPGQPERFFSLDPTGNVHRKAGKYMVGYARGFYGEFGDLPQRMEAYAQEHALTFTGPLYAMYLLDEICMDNVSQYTVQVCVGVTKRPARRL